MIFKEKKESAFTEEDKTSVFFSENINDLIDCARALKGLEAAEKSGALYCADGTFFLLLSGSPGKKRSVLSEYLEEAAFTEERLGFLKEYGKCLIERDALAVLST